MRDNPEVWRQLLAAFLQELEEHVQTINSGLLALESGELTDGDGLHKLFRAAHSLKGASGAFHLKPIEQVCHWLEDRLQAARDGLLPEPQEFALLFAAIDAVQAAGQRLAAGEELGTRPLLPWIEDVGSAATAVPDGGDVVIGATPAPSPPSEALPEVAHAAPVAAGPVTEASFLKVAVSRLDALYAGSGELLRARLRLQECSQLLQDLHERVSRWQVAWRTVDAWSIKARARESAAVANSAVLATLEEGSEELRDIRQALEALATRMQADDLVMQSVVGRLQTLIGSVRLQPFGEICHGLERVVRDVSRGGGKEVQLHISGTEVELDRSILSSLRDPLLHLVRNAVDHGLEKPDERAAAGKPRVGQVTVLARIVGARIEVVVTDDGKGLDVEAIRAKAQSKGWAVPSDDREATRLIFKPGFSTARQITDVSGRGVGLDVVKSQVEALNGTVDLVSEKGKGTRFLLVSPLTLSSLRALMLGLDKQVYAMPSSSVERALRVRLDDLKMVANRPVMLANDCVIPVAHLSSVLTRSGSARSLQNDAPALLLGSPPRQALIVVDQLLSEHEITIQGMGARLGHPVHFSGASVLPDGRIILILNASALIASVLEEEGAGRLNVAAHEQRRRRLMVADDSMPVRSLEKSLLESAGYEVVAAVDGADAWEKLQENPVDLVVSDVDMPRMTGLQLVKAVRDSEAHRHIPVILVTSLASEEQKFAGLLAGANAYLVKSEFDQQQLLEIVAQLL